MDLSCVLFHACVIIVIAEIKLTTKQFESVARVVKSVDIHLIPTVKERLAEVEREIKENPGAVESAPKRRARRPTDLELDGGEAENMPADNQDIEDPERTCRSLTLLLT